jgi:hypothetical protein
MDYPGRPPPEELPQKPFGLVPTSLAEFKLPPIEKELGLRSGFTDKVTDENENSAGSRCDSAVVMVK